MKPKKTVSKRRLVKASLRKLTTRDDSAQNEIGKTIGKEKRGKKQ